MTPPTPPTARLTVTLTGAPDGLARLVAALHAAGVTAAALTWSGRTATVDVAASSRALERLALRVERLVDVLTVRTEQLALPTRYVVLVQPAA